MSRLAAILREQYGHLGITGLREIGHGLDARVYRGSSAVLGDVAVRVPHVRYLTSGNETQLDTRRQLRQDFELSGHLRAHGLPVPEVFALHLADDGGPDFTIGEFVSSDGSSLSDEAFGGLIRAIHSVPVPAVDLVCMEGHDSVDLVLAERIGDRFGKLAARTPLGVDLPPIAALLAADPCPRRRLLHMDLRPENVLVRSGRPVALLDWSNALIGDPALDLARAAEYRALAPTALAAYGDPGGFTLVASAPRQVVYRLDTAVMLSHVFLDGAPDAGKARHYTDRVRSLCRVLGQYSSRRSGPMQRCGSVAVGCIGDTNKGMQARLLLVHSPLVGCGTWEPIADDLAGDGYAVTVPDLAGAVAAGPPYALRQAEVIVRSAADEPAILIGHSRAGPLLSTAGTMLGERVRGYVFVDARLPSPGHSWMETVQPDLADRLREMADPEGWLPPWPQWWSADELAVLLPDPTVRQSFAAGCPRLPMAMLEEIHPPAPGWPAAPGGYLQLSEAYEGDAARARELGWPVRQHLSHHLALLTEPGQVAREIRKLVGEP